MILARAAVAVLLTAFLSPSARAWGKSKEADPASLTYKDVFQTVSPKVLRDSKRVAVVCYHAQFVLQEGASAKSFQMLGGDGTGIKSASLNVTLGNVGPKDFQEIADKGYENFVAELKAAGREVVSLDDVKKTESFKKLELTPVADGKPYGKVYKVTASKSYTVVSPSGIPLYFMHSDALGDRGSFALGNFKTVAAIAKELDALVVCPNVTVNFVNLSSDGRSLFAPSVGVSAGAVISLEPGTSIVSAWNKGWAGAAAAFKVAVPVEGLFGDFDKDPKSINRYNSMAGVAGFNSTSEAAVFVADPAKYKALAIQAHQKAAQYYGELLKEYAPK